ncbi:MAG: DUF5050 domain-containing protein [Ruminococcus sp.]|nr:DUF5050 domain-containing protein [Ruminococcus sp.]
MKHTKRFFTLDVARAVTLSSCGAKKETEKSVEMPSDNPGGRQIMETESGYYYNNEDFLLSLRYSEKSTDADIFLCPKPECRHDGNESCTATYNFSPITNTILYDNYIYFVADEKTKENLGYALYKVSLDGTTLDKVCDVAKIMNPNEDNYSGYGSMPQFIIHKGYAYIPYMFGALWYGQYIQSGFVKVNIQTGEKEILFEETEYKEGKEATVIGGHGDYIYYSVRAQKPMYGGDFRMNVITGETERLKGQTQKGDNVYGLEKWPGIVAFGESAFYVTKYYKETDSVSFAAIDYQTLKPNGVEIMPSEKNMGTRFVPYDDKLYVLGQKELKIYSEKGELIKAIPCEENQDDGYLNISSGDGGIWSSDTRTFAVNNDKIYIGIPKGEQFILSENMLMTYCTIEDALNGNPEWKTAYETKSWDNYWKDYPSPKMLEKMQEQNFDE